MAKEFLEDEEEQYTISVSRNEALFLDDSFTLLIQRDPDEYGITLMRPVQMTAGLGVPMELMEKIGKAVLYTTESKNLGKEYEFKVTISDLYMIREVASSFVRVGDEPVGYNLKRKVCNILYGDSLEKESSDEIVSKLLQDVNKNLTPKPNTQD